MGTNDIRLKSEEQFMADYQPVYQPIVGLFLQNSKTYPQEVGKIDFKRVNTVGDIRGKQINPKDTEIKKIAIGESTKTFNKYFIGNQFTHSTLQSTAKDMSDINAQVLDEHNKHADEILLFGEGTADNDVLNNGVFFSGDSNHVTNLSATVAAGDAGDHLKDLHSKIVGTLETADENAGRKLLLYYGDTIAAKFNSIHATSDTSFRSALQNAKPNWSMVRVPKAIQPASGNGWLTINLDQVKLHYTLLPMLKSQGINEEKMYAWFNFLMGSMMVECLVSGSITRQPCTFE